MNGNFTIISNEFMGLKKTMKESEKDMYEYFARFRNASSDGYVEASISDIMRYTGIMNRNTVSKAIIRLVELGWIEDIIHQKGVGKKEGKNKYLINDSPKVNIELLKRERARRNSRRKDSTKSVQGDSTIGIVQSGWYNGDSTVSDTVFNKEIENGIKDTDSQKENTQPSDFAKATSSVVEEAELPLVEDNLETKEIDTHSKELSNRFSKVITTLKNKYDSSTSKSKRETLENKINSLTSEFNIQSSPFINTLLLKEEIELGLR